MRTRLGRIGLGSATSMFYAQAQVMAYYLYAAESGALRAKLLDYLAAYYRGDDAGLDPRAAFGTSPDELGARAIAFVEAELR